VNFVSVNDSHIDELYFDENTHWHARDLTGRQDSFRPAGYGFPTKVVTDFAVSEAENRALVTAMAVPEASLELSVVTYGVTDAGHAVPATKKLAVWALPPFTTTMATVPSARFVNATTRGTVPEGFGAPLTSTR
jgi:hypothetical protein